MSFRPQNLMARFAFWGVCSLGLCLSNGIAIGQTATGQVNGTVTDQSKAAVPAATAILVNRATGIETRASTNASGFFTFINVSPGVYTLRIEAAGFRAAQIPEFTVGVNQTVTEDVGLSLGQVTEVVEVAAQAESLQQSSAELGTVIAQQAVQELPLNGRNFTQLLTLTPGATPVSTSQGAQIGVNDGSTVSIPRSGFSNPSIHGQFNRSSVYFLDGIINTDFRTTTYTILPNIDLIQEFKVQSHNDKAEYGGVAGGVINVVSASGTNQLHGSAYEFVRNNDFDARDSFFDATRTSPAPYRQNQFGATLGGPIIKNKTFFSGGYEGWRYSSPTGSRYRVPTDQEISGDFSNSIIAHNIYDPLTTRPNPSNPNQLIRDQFPGNMIPSSRISPMTQGFIQTYFDRPNLSDPVFNVILNQAQTNDNNSWQVKVDHQWNEKNSLFFRYSGMNVHQNTPTTLKQNNYLQMTAKNFGGGVLHTFTPTLILDVRGGFASRPFLFGTDSSAGLAPQAKLGFTGTDQFGGVTLSLLSPWGSAGIGPPQPRGNPVWSFSPNLSWLHGNHNVKTGFQIISVNRLQIAPGINYQFDDATTSDPQQPGKTGASLASALLGMPRTFSGNSAQKNRIDFDIPIWSAYVQDEWRLKPAVTLTLGLRFDYVGRPTLNAGMNNGPNMLTGNWEIGGGKLPPPCNQGGGAPCIPGNGLQDVPFSEHIVVAKDPLRWRQPQWNEFGPRISVAWRATNRIVVRAGYSILYDALPAQSQTYQNTLNQWPFSGGFSDTANAIGAPPTFIQDLQGSFPLPLPAASPWGISTWFSAPDRQDAQSHQWNVEIQRQMTDNLLLSAAYVGSYNRHIDVNGLANTAVTPGPGSPDQVNQRRPYPWMGSFPYDNSIGNSNYNAFEFKASRRFAHGFQALVSYTWSKSIDTASSGWYSAENGPGGSSSFQNYYDLNGSRSVSSYDIPHFLSISSNWELPVGRGKALLNKGLASWILGDWQANMIAQFRSGQPFTLSVPGDVANIGNSRPQSNYARPNLIGDPYLSNPTASQFFNTAAFQIPIFSYGNFGRNVLRGAHVSNVDFSLFKTLPISQDGRRKLEFRAEAFNVLNIMNWAPPGSNGALGSGSAPGATVGQTGFGRVTALAAFPRTIQLGLRLLF